MDYRRDIQGLRAIAVLFVFIFHLNANWLPGGFIGVDIFFVISGFLISSIILSKLDKKKFSFFDFYKSRLKRIVPAYCFLLIAITIIGVVVYVSSDIHAFRKALFWSTIFNSNYYFSTIDTYFGTENSENPFLHTWTLAVEMQFYLFLPLLLVFIKRKWLPVFVSVVIVVLFIYGSLNVFNGNKNQIYFSLLARIPEFLIGVLCSLVPYKFDQSKNIAFFLSVLGILLLLTSAILINADSDFPGILAAVPCLGTAFLLISSSQNPVGTFLTNKALFFIGELSYSIYLWHWPIMAFFRYYNNTYEFTGFQVIVVVITTFTLSVFSYYFIERRFRKMKGFKLGTCLALFFVVNVAAIFCVIPINGKASNIPLSYTTPLFGINSHGNSFKYVETFGDTLVTKYKVLLLGDSHALCMKPYFDYMGKKYAFSFKTITNNSYPTIPSLSPEIFDTDRYYQQYINLMKYANKEITESDIIILGYQFNGDEWYIPVNKLINNLKDNQ